MTEFKDKVVVITGGAQGIGRCIAEEFAEAGANICIIDRQEGNHYMGMGAAGETMSESSNPWIAGAGKALYYADPWMAIPTLATAPVKWGAETVSPWLKEYYRSKYYDSPPNILGHLYKTFNPLNRSYLYEAVWHDWYTGDTRTLDNHIQRLRKKLDLGDTIETVFRIGYRLNIR